MFEQQLQIETPENVVFGYEVAGIGSRFMATMIDSLILMLLFVLGAVAGGFLTSSAESLISGSAGWIAAIFTIITFLIFFGYYVIFETVWNGQTPGRRMFGLRVVDLEGVPIGLAAAAIRNLVRLIDFLPLFYGLGVVVMFINSQSRRLGDLAAGTLVVHDRQVTLSSLTDDSFRPRPDIPSDVADRLPVGRLSAESVLLARDFLARRGELVTERGLIRPILQRLYDEMGLTLEDQIPYIDAIARLKEIAHS